MKAENILIAIAQENGFDTWEQYFECFRTTDAGRRVINKGILKAVNQALILSSVVGRSDWMKTLKEQDYTINICTDIIEWAKEFYGMPDGAELANEEEVNSECMGFAQLDEKLVWVFVPKEYDLKDLKETIAHEIGHIVEMEYPTNPEQIEANDELHEMKADHYMNFYLLVDKTVADVVDALAGN